MGAQVYGERWKIVEQIGEGGQAHTFEVVDVQGDAETRYVLKRLKNVKRLGRFKQEVEAIQSLDHPNVIKLIDYNLDSDKPYLVTEFCRGGNLEEHVSKWSQNPVEALCVFIQICEGVAAAHQHEKEVIVHRDLKPANILLREPDGFPVVADFGICYVENGERHTLVDEAAGPRLYIAPELEDGRLEEVPPASDVYSLGKLLYWLISGGKIFSREKHRDPQFNLVQILDNGILEHINRLLDKMIVSDPNQRIQDAAAVAAEARKVARLLQGNYRVVSPNLPQLCMYCGEGHYKLIVEGAGERLRNFGFTPMASSDWRVMVCEQCGHVQLFRVDMAQRKDWWRKS